MKRYALFTSQDYEAGGGWSDLTGLFDSVGEAREHSRGRLMTERFQVVDLRSENEEHAIVIPWGQLLYEELGYNYGDLISGRVRRELGRD